MKLIIKKWKLLFMSFMMFVLCYLCDFKYCVEYGGKYTAFHYGIYMFGVLFIVYCLSEIRIKRNSNG